MRLNGPVVELLCYERRVGNRELARRVGKTSQFLLRARRGERTLSESTIKSIASALEVPPETITLPEPQKAAR